MGTSNCRDGFKRDAVHEITMRGHPTREAARQDVFEYIEMFCCPTRRHTNNGMPSPVDFEEEQLNLDKAGVWETRGSSRPCSN